MSVMVYLAGPMGTEPLLSEVNVPAAIDAAHTVREMGGFPWVPHLCVLWHARHPRDYEDWLEYDAEWLLRCDAVLRIPGRSPGADREVALAETRGIPVFFDLPTLEKWLRGARPDPAQAATGEVGLLHSGSWARPELTPERSK